MRHLPNSLRLVWPPLLLLVASASWSAPKSAPVQVTFGPMAEIGPACSPDGLWIAFEYFEKKENTTPKIWLMSTVRNYADARPVVSDEIYHAGISWSPDSQWISYMGADAKESTTGNLTSQIYKVNTITRKVERLTELPLNTVVEDTTSWSSTDQIAFSMNNDIYAVNASGGEARKVLTASTLTNPPSPPQDLAWSPDGKELAFVIQDSAGPRGRQTDTGSLWIADAATQHSRKVLARKQLAGILWIEPDGILLALQDKKGLSRIFLLSPRTGSVRQITDGPLDLWGCYSREVGSLFYNHSRSVRARFDRALVPHLHIWRRSFSLPGSQSGARIAQP